MPIHLDLSFLTAARPYLIRLVSLLSGVDFICHSPSPTAFPEFLCPTPYSRSLPTSGCVEISSPNPLSGFMPKQTKESSAWMTTYIVSQITLRHFLRIIDFILEIINLLKISKSIAENHLYLFGYEFVSIKNN